MIRIIGDGVGGLLVAEELNRRGIPAFLVGERAEPPPGITALVHPFAGRSLEMSEEERLAWSAAQPVLESFVARGWSTRSVMLRPLDGAAGDRLRQSLRRNEAHLRDGWGVRIEEDPALGNCIRYEPAYGVDMREALRGLRKGKSYEPQPFDATILAPGARLLEWIAGDDLRVFGGELVVVPMAVATAISGRGVHVTPTIEGSACAGSTWWTPEEPLDQEVAARDIAGRLARVVDEVAPTTTWSGWRCVYQPDRRPVVGRLAERTFVAGALGTRGWLWGAVVAREVAGALAGAPVHPALDVARTTLRLIRA